MATWQDVDDVVAALPATERATAAMHFDGHPAVLARLDALPVDVLSHLVQAEWRRSAPKRVVAAHERG